jgi:membrane protein implicated in regulation of membrane protease activity
MVGPLTKPILIRKAVELMAAIAAGIGLWRFTSGHWLSGIVFVAAVGGVSAWYLWKSRRVDDGRRY